MLNSFSKWQVDCEPRETKYIWFSLSVWKTEKSQLPLLIPMFLYVGCDFGRPYARQNRFEFWFLKKGNLYLFFSINFLFFGSSDRYNRFFGIFFCFPQTYFNNVWKFYRFHWFCSLLLSNKSNICDSFICVSSL